jgi:hypothetical protein
MNKNKNMYLFFSVYNERFKCAKGVNIDTNAEIRFW